MALLPCRARSRAPRWGGTPRALAGVGRAAVGVALVAALTLGLVPGVPVPGTAPAGAAAAALRLVRTEAVALGTLGTTSGTNEYFSSPAVADLNGDLKPEVVVAAPNGTVTASRVDNGATLWQRSLGTTAIQASPIVNDITSDGRTEVIVATMDGRVVILNGQNGGVMRTFRQGAPLHCPAGVDCRPDGFFATPSVADINGDGSKEIIAPSWDHTVYAWNVNGRLLWRAYLYDTLWSSPAVLDVNGDGRTEVVLGGDISSGNPLGVPQGGLLWVLNGGNGTRFSGYPISMPGQTTWSSPAIADVNGDGRFEAVVGTGVHGPFGDGSTARRVSAITLVTRRNIPGWPVVAPGRVMGQPAVGDVDGDARPEVVVGSEGGYVTVFEHTGARKWANCNLAACADRLPTHGGVVIADVDDDGRQDVISALSQRLRIYDGATRATKYDARLSGGNGVLGPSGTAAVGEVNGIAVIAQSYFSNTNGRQGAPAAGRTQIRTDIFSTDRPLCGEDWPAFKRGPARTSILRPRQPWHPFACGRPFVTQHYSDLLGRQPDAAGLTYWTLQLRTSWSGARVVEGFMSSPEFGGRAAPIVRLHLGLKGGPPLPSQDIRGQMARARGGTSLATIASEMVAAGPWASQTDADFVNGVYPRLWGAAPTVQQRNRALAAIASGGRGQWLADFSREPWVVGVRAGQVQVAMTYIGLLDRGPDPGGWNYWIGQVNRGISVQRLIALFLDSPEYRERVL